MTTAEDLAPLWGGRLTRISFDPVTHSCSLEAEVLDAGRSTTYRLECQGVAELRFHSSIPDPWSYAELTEADLAIDPSTGMSVLSLMLWSEDAGMEIRAQVVSLHELLSSS